MNTREVGKQNEQEVSNYFENNGYQVVANNYHVGKLELDLIVSITEQNLSILIFVEVKFRKTHPDYDPGLALRPAQQRRLLRAAEMFIQQHPIYQRFYARFDVVLVTEQGGKKEIEHIKNAFIKT